MLCFVEPLIRVCTVRIAYRHSDRTPLPTPSYKYNAWMGGDKKLRNTPRDESKCNIALYLLLVSNVIKFNDYLLIL